MKKLTFLILFHAFFVFYTKAQHYVFYGITGAGGKFNDGMIYKYDPLTGQYDTLFSIYPEIGIETWAGLTLADNGLLYGTTEAGGGHNYGTMFSYNRIDNKCISLINFDSLHNGQFDASCNTVMQASNGLLYGTTEAGGYGDRGVFYSYNIKTGKDSIIFSFDTLDMSTPNRTVVEDTNTGYFYGTTQHGGPKNFGTIFRYDPKTNKDTIVFDFDTTNNGGVMPVGSTLFMAANGIFYGLTDYGGGTYFNGTLFSFDPQTNKDSTLIVYGANYKPGISNLMRASDGSLYGLSLVGGTYSYGTLFSYNIIANTQTTLVNFNSNDGNEPTGDLVQDPDNGKLYGVTNTGGKYNMGVLFCYDIKTGKDSVCVNFNGTNGAYPDREPTLVWDTTKADTTNAIKQLKAENIKVEIYPNPNNGKFTIECGTEKERAVVEIYNVMGELIKSEELRDKSTIIDILNQSAGIYLYRVLTKRGALISSGKFVIE